MTAFDPIARQLSLAREGLTPPSELRARVRARFGASDPALPAVAARSGSRVLAERWRALRASGNLGLAVGLGLFGLGCVVGLLGAELGLKPHEEAASRSALHAAAPALVKAAETPDPPALPAGPAPSASAEAPPALAAPVAPAASAPERAPRAGARAQPAPRPPRRAPPARDWRGELELLERAERAVRADNVALALALLGDFDERYPASRLVEERAAVETMAHCQAQATDAAARAARFSNDYPSSLYRTRVASLCPSPASAAAARSGRASDSRDGKPFDEASDNASDNPSGNASDNASDNQGSAGH